MIFKERLKQLRLENNMLQKELAEKIGVARSSVTKYELGTGEPNLETLLKLCDIFDCSLDYLLGRSEIKKATNNFVVAVDPSKNITIDDLNNLIDYIEKLKKK